MIVAKNTLTYVQWLSFELTRVDYLFWWCRTWWLRVYLNKSKWKTGVEIKPQIENKLQIKIQSGISGTVDV